jgi:hypothetical protein
MSQSESSSNNFNSLDRTDDNPIADSNVRADFENNTDINNNNNNVYFDYPIDYDSDEESYVDDDSTDDNINSDDDNDPYDDLENLILDQLEFEHNNKVLFGNHQTNQDESAANDNDDREDH